jgi:hypothetical protein
MFTVFVESYHPDGQLVLGMNVEKRNEETSGLQKL